MGATRRKTANQLKTSSQEKPGICPELRHYLNPCVRIAKAQITVLSGAELLKVNQRKDGFSSCFVFSVSVNTQAE